MLGIFLACGLIWYLLVHTILVKHINQGARRMMRDMEQGSLPRLGQPRPWEPGERMERGIMKWSTVALLLLAAALYLTLQFG